MMKKSKIARKVGAILLVALYIFFLSACNSHKKKISESCRKDAISYNRYSI